VGTYPSYQPSCPSYQPSCPSYPSYRPPSPTTSPPHPATPPYHSYHHFLPPSPCYPYYQVAVEGIALRQLEHLPIPRSCVVPRFSVCVYLTPYPLPLTPYPLPLTPYPLNPWPLTLKP